MRKIIQIAALEDGSLFALCDDGTAWLNNDPSAMPSRRGRWHPLVAIPQDDTTTPAPSDARDGGPTP